MTNNLEVMQEIVAEDLQLMQEVILEDLQPLIEYRRKLEKDIFSKAYQELQELESEA